MNATGDGAGTGGELTGAPRLPAATGPGDDVSALDLRPLLEEVVRRGASDLHLTVGERPMLRVDGRLEYAAADAHDGDAACAGRTSEYAAEHARAGEAAGPGRTSALAAVRFPGDARGPGREVEFAAATDGGDVARRRLVAGDTAAMARSLVTDAQWARFEAEHELDFSFQVEELSRFRANLFLQRGCVALAIRQIPMSVRPLEALDLPAIVPRLAELPRGLVLVTGPTGSGKSTTLAAMIDRINRERRGHILTVEDPIEFVHRHRGCIVNQREVGSDTRSFASALKYAMRQDPDVVLVGEMRDLETIHAALTIAETGHLAFATLHTNSAAETVNRIIDVFPAGQQAQVRAQLAFVLQGVVTQTLVPRSGGCGRVCCCEVLVSTPAVRACIREDKVHQLYTLMQSGRKHGMQTLNEALWQQVGGGAVALETALQHSSDPNELLRLAGRPVPA